MHSVSVTDKDVKHVGYRFKPYCIRRYVIKLQCAAFYNLQNRFIDVSTECAVFIFSVQVE